ncbi:MAG: hypothetical protein KGZ73_05270 [Rhizobiales bacterium]|nr:hypothetical protein [Hyphomicrobiales bacterium]
MSLEEKIAEVRALISQRDEIDRKIAELLGGTTLKVAPQSRQRKWHKADSKGKELKNEIDQFHQRKGHKDTEQIERLLIEGKTVGEVVQLVEVSAPTVYIIKARLKRDGKIL